MSSDANIIFCDNKQTIRINMEYEEDSSGL